MSLNLDKYREIYKKKISGQKDEKFVTLADGDTRVRILPPKTNDQLIYFEFGSHYIDSNSYTCPQVTYKKPCPLCDFAKKLFSTKNEADRQIALDVRAKKRYFFNCIVRGEENKGVRILAVGVKLYTKIIEALVNEEIGDITDPKNGYDLVIKKKQIGGYANYDSSEFARKSSLLSDNIEEIKKWYAERFDLEEQISACMSYEDLKQVLENGGGSQSVNTTADDIVVDKTNTKDETDGADEIDIVLEDTDTDTDVEAKEVKKDEAKPTENKSTDDDDFESQLRDLMN